MKRIAFIVQLPKGVSPGQRFRVEAYEPLLLEQGAEIDTFPFFSERVHRVLYKPGHYFAKVSGLFSGFARRFALLFKLHRYDYVFVQRESAPLGPPIFEFIATRILGSKLIYDYDDAIWVPNVSKENWLAGWFKCFWKVKYICRWSYKVAAGNEYLCDFARRSGAKNVVCVPTVVDTDTRYVPDAAKPQATVPVVGWTGSHSTLKYLDAVIPVLQELEKDHRFTFRVIADKDPRLPLKSVEFVPWSPVTEIHDLQAIDIGIMPLPHDPWSEGKCGFKLIQYLALGIPAVASPVGVNKTIIEEGQNGYLAADAEGWRKGITTLLQDANLRAGFGQQGREKMVLQYSIASQAQPFLALFDMTYTQPK